MRSAVAVHLNGFGFALCSARYASIACSSAFTVLNPAADSLLGDRGDGLEQHNADPKPFAWVADADAILDRIKKVCERTSDSGH
jgi:hypothetical protein